MTSTGALDDVPDDDRTWAIIDAARDLLESRGSDFTAQELVSTAHVSLSALYRFFGSKDRVIVAVFAAAIEDLCESMRHRADGIDDPIRRLHCHARSLLLASAHPDIGMLARLLAVEFSPLLEQFPAQMATAFAPLHELFDVEVARVKRRAPEAIRRQMTLLGLQLALAMFRTCAEQPREQIESNADILWSFLQAAWQLNAPNLQDQHPPGSSGKNRPNSESSKEPAPVTTSPATAYETFGDIEDVSLPLAILVHGFPDTPFTWRHLREDLTNAGYRVATPWLRGYHEPSSGPISAGTYVKDVLNLRRQLSGDHRTVLIGHDWGAQAAYGAVHMEPESFDRLVTLSIAPVAALGAGMFTYRQIKRSFYIWFIQTGALAEAAMLAPEFWEGLWDDWSPGYDGSMEIEAFRAFVGADNIANVVAPYRASFQPELHDPDALVEAQSTVQIPKLRTLCICGAQDGAMGAELLGNVGNFLPAAGSRFELVDDVGHFLHLEKPDLVNGLILDWLRWG